MENSKRTAFPKLEANPVNSGLTKREYFAGLAMQGILASGNGVKTLVTNNSKYPDTIVGKSLEYADELLKQLETN